MQKEGGKIIQKINKERSKEKENVAFSTYLVCKRVPEGNETCKKHPPSNVIQPRTY